MTCPTDEERFAFFSGALGPPVSTHVQSCAECQRRIDEWRRLGRALQSAPPSPSALEVDAVVARAMVRPVPSRIPVRWLAGIAATALGLVAAGLLMPRQDQATARGGSSPFRQRVSLRLVADPDGLVEAGTSVSRHAAFTVAAFGLAQGDALGALAFIVDSKGIVHWVAPGWVDETRVPAPAVLSVDDGGSRSGAVWTLGESVRFDDLAAGPAGYFSVVDVRPLSVLAVERMADKNPAGLSLAFPGALIGHTSFVVTESTP